MAPYADAAAAQAEAPAAAIRAAILDVVRLAFTFPAHVVLQVK